jgi:hypothetical protein
MRIAVAAPGWCGRPALLMLRALVYGLTLLHLGPGLAFAVLAFGCEGTAGVLGALCSRPVLPTFAALTLGAWVILGAALAAVLLVRHARVATTNRTRARVAALLAVLTAGTLFGAGAAGLTGSDAGYLALPAALITAWLFLADPTTCTPAPLAGSTPESTP